MYSCWLWAGILIALYFRGLGKLLHRKLHLPFYGGKNCLGSAFGRFAGWLLVRRQSPTGRQVLDEVTSARSSSNFSTLINIPPALIIIAQLLMGVLTGGWGLLLATPLMLIIMLLTQELYVKKQGTA